MQSVMKYPVFPLLSTAIHGRLYKVTKNGNSRGAWCARNNAAGEYLQIDLGKSKTVNAVATQGRYISIL